jgi:hypothetical protein
LIDQYKILRSASDPSFVAKAFANYCASQQQRFSDLMEFITTAMTYFDDIVNIQQVNDFITSDGRFSPEAKIPTDYGYVELNVLVCQLINCSNDTEGSFDSSTTTLWVINDSDNWPNLVTVDEVIDQLKQSLHSITALTGAALASSYDTVASKLSYFRDYVSRTFQNAFADISGMISRYSLLLEKTNNATEFLNSVHLDLGVEELADDLSTKVIADTDIYKYTGASPMGPLDFGSAISAASSGLKIGAKIVSNLFKGIFNLGKSLFSTAKKYIIDVAVDPFDLEVINSDVTDGIIDGFAYIKKNEQYIYEHSTEEYPDLYLDVLDNAFSSHKDLAFNFFCCNVGFTNIQPVIIEGQKHKITYDVMVKPKPVNLDTFRSLFSTYYHSNASGSWLSGSIDDACEKLSLLIHSPNLYYSSKDGEAAMYKGYAGSVVIFKMLLIMAGYELDGEPDFYIDLNDASMNIFDESWDQQLPSPVTNADFVSIVSGWNSVSQTFEFPFFWITFLLQGYCNLVKDRHDYPLDFPFMPYMNDGLYMGTPQYSIKTDQQNYDRFNNVATTFIIAVAAVVIVGMAVVKLRKVAFKAIATKAGLQRQLENELASGVYNKDTFKAFRKARRKANMLSFFSSGLQNASTAVAISDDGSASIIQLIAG